MSKSVVVVESPSKAKTINKYLGDDFKVIASFGHIRDLPSQNESVETDNDFNIKWQVSSKGNESIREIEKALEKSDSLYLATDPDREGEAISWHVSEILKDKGVLENKRVSRIVFNEINKTAIKKAMENPRDINLDLVDAYLARRALDYLVGFNLSPLLWRKVPGAKSAGRVQSVALRLIVDREEEIEVFKKTEYWHIESQFITNSGKSILGKLDILNGKKLKKFDIPDEESVQKIVDILKNLKYHIGGTTKKKVNKNPQAPFITSTLQQEASGKLGFSIKKTMLVAQKLYEGINILGETKGLITYMRTDSVTISDEAAKSIRSYIKENFESSYLPKAKRTYKNKVKNAQEAHEAIRCTFVEYHPKDIDKYLNEDQKKLYELIWKRTVASQMENAIFEQVSITINDYSEKNSFQSSGSTLVFDGFLRVYQDSENDKEKLEILDLKDIVENTSVDFEKITPKQHFTQPPPRYSEASLVKKMEELGIGRPSTYVPLLQMLRDRKYAKLDKKQFFPEDIGRVVTSFLKNFFLKYVEYDFTAGIEEELDEVSSGERKWKDVLGNFWKIFIAEVEKAKELKVSDVISIIEKDFKSILFGDNLDKICPKCSKGNLSLKLSKFGAFLGCSDYPECKYTKSAWKAGEEDAIELEKDIFIGYDPETNEEIVLKKGPYGYYFNWNIIDKTSEDQSILDNENKSSEGDIKDIKPTKRKTVKSKIAKDKIDKDKIVKDKSSDGKTVKSRSSSKKKIKPKRVTFPKTLNIEDASLDLALKLKKIPAKLGTYPNSEDDIIVSVGKFGPYVKVGEKFVSIPKTIANYWDVTLNEAIEIIDKKKENDAKRKKKTNPVQDSEIIAQSN